MKKNPTESHKSAFFTPFTDIIICPRSAPLVSHWVLTHGRFRFALEKKKRQPTPETPASLTDSDFLLLSLCICHSSKSPENHTYR